MKDMCVTQLALNLDATTPSTEPRSSKTVVTTIEKVLNLDTCIICVFLGDVLLRTKCRQVFRTNIP